MSPQATKSDEWRAGYRVVLGSAIGLGTGFSVWPYVSSTFVLPLGDAFGWTRGQVSTVAATGLVGAALAPFVGGLVDRAGVRRVLLPAIVVLGVAYTALSFMTGSLTIFYLLFTVLGIAGLGTIGITYTRAVAGWFSAARGTALGLSLLGVSIAALLLPPLLSGAMASYGWAAGYRILAVLAVLVGLPAAFLLVHEKPRIAAEVATHTPWGRIVRAPVFWLLIVAILLVNIPGAGILGQLQPILTDAGLSRGQAAAMLSIYAGSVFAGRLGFGFLLDRVPPTLIAALAFGIPAVGAALLIDGKVGQVEAVFIAALLGLSAGAELDIMGYFVARYFGLKHYSALFGAMMTALVVANATGNILYGRGFDATGGYGQALIMSIGGYVLGAAAMLVVGRLNPVLNDEEN
jgi:MFS family permease